MVRPNKIIILLVKILVSGGLLYAVISRTGTDRVLSTLKGIDIFSFFLAVLIYVVTVFISTVRWRLLLHEDFAMKRLFSLYLIGSFFNHLLPGIIGGDAVKAYYLYRDTGRGSSAVASVFMDRYIGFTALMLLGLTAFPFGFSYFRGSYLEWILPLIVLIFIAGSFLVFGLRIGRGIKSLSGLYDYFAVYKGKKTVIAETLFLSILIQALVICAVYILSRGLKVYVPLLPLFIFIPVISTIATLPISISGIGVREASFVLLFGFLGTSPAQATAVSFAWFLSMAAGSLPGLIEYLRYRKGGHESMAP
ncbi:MAG TPA: lysylphosphatidylglycerol synthase transmembrane domain-containing protein [Thermodesulfovibrionales bacterium]|nr:lysylphosphatidylglycerol synthase transmembrane domain-containing protein [Thermodesulfovibrionales bacterium]